MKNIKFRAWDKQEKYFRTDFIVLPTGKILYGPDNAFTDLYSDDGTKIELQQFTGLLDKNGKEIYEGDVLEFSDRWEWYKSKYWVEMQFAKDNVELKKLKAKLAAEPLETREVKIPDCYEEFSNDDLQFYWEIIGNIYENPELLK